MEVESKTIRGVTYECRELTFNEMIPILENAGANTSLELIKSSVTVDGKVIGEDAGNLGFYTVKRLLAVVNKINGITDEEDGEEKL